MTKRDDRVISVQRIPVNAGPIQPAAPGRNLPQGQDRAPTRLAGPKMTTPPVTIRADGGYILGRQWNGKSWGPWDVLSERDLQLMIGEPPAPKRRPYTPGT